MAADAWHTPGRVAWVMFSHQSDVELLCQKEKGWMAKTGGGKIDTGELGREVKREGDNGIKEEYKATVITSS